MTNSSDILLIGMIQVNYVGEYKIKYFFIIFLVGDYGRFLLSLILEVYITKK